MKPAYTVRIRASLAWDHVTQSAKLAVTPSMLVSDVIEGENGILCCSDA